LETEKVADAASMALAVQSAAESAPVTPQKVFTLPFIWAWGAPVFAAGAATLIKLQALSGIPWLTFITLCGFGVRAFLAPMMIR